jgi:hypothetical protein
MSTEAEHNYNQQQQFLREKIRELSSKSMTQREIASVLKVGVGTVNRHIQALRQQCKENISEYVDRILPHEYDKCMVGIDNIIKTCWSRADSDTANDKERYAYLSLAKDSYSMKLELLNSSTIVEKAVKFVSSNNARLTEQNDNPLIDHKHVEGTKKNDIPKQLE